MVTRRTALKTGAALGALAAGGVQSTAFAQDAGAQRGLRLWYTRPAELWTEALPIGNGRLGAMIFGGVARERLQLNEDTLYAGGPYDPSNPEALAALPRVRELIAAGKYLEAQNLAQEKMMARPIRMPSYQTVGDLLLELGSSSFADAYRRELDLATALASVEYRRDGVNFRREMFASAVDQVIVTRITAQREDGGAGAVDMRVSFATPMPGGVSIDADTLVLAGTNTSQHDIPAALRYEARARMLAPGGRVSACDGGLSVTGAKSVVILVAMATNYKRFDDIGGDPSAITRAQLTAAAGKSYEALFAAHAAAHQRLFRRVTLDLGNTPAAGQPTDVRIRSSQTSDDPQLATLYFQYARYLLISCSRPGTQPANLQGLWNDKLSAPWGSKHTININTQMNYWPAEPANLPECVQPLIALVKDLAVTGARTARVHYGARGWVAHHNTDLWRATGPIDSARYGMWPTGGAWLCKHLWDVYDYGRDRTYLADVYPVLKGAAEFFLDTLVEDPSGKYLVTSPSMSPENLHPHGAAICAGPAMDSQILRDLFASCIRTAEILGRDAQFRAACAAARKSLELRGDLSTGWAIAWRINLWARLRDAEHTHAVIKLLLDQSRTYPNLFDAHPPFQIDGNFGGANGILKMLLQCVDGEIELLPALPRAWPTGAVRGVRARGGFELDIVWRDGALLSAELRGTPGGEARVRYRDRLRIVRVRQGARATLMPSQFR